MAPEAVAALIGGGFVLTLLVVWIVFCVLLIIAPLMVWKWSKRTCAAVDELRAAVVALDKRLSAAHTQSLSELRLIREASRHPGMTAHKRSPVMPPTIPPPEAMAVCPECGGVFEFDAKISEVDVTCPSCHKPFHIH